MPRSHMPWRKMILGTIDFFDMQLTRLDRGTEGGGQGFTKRIYIKATAGPPGKRMAYLITIQLDNWVLDLDLLSVKSHGADLVEVRRDHSRPAGGSRQRGASKRTGKHRSTRAVVTDRGRESSRRRVVRRRGRGRRRNNKRAERGGGERGRRGGKRASRKGGTGPKSSSHHGSMI